MSQPAPVSILILTLNEETNLPTCLAAVRSFDDIVVLDSGSTDRTVAIAREAGARVVTNPFKDFASQRNFAHETVAFRHPWVLHLDADEIMTPELVAECTNLPDNPALDGYYVAPRMMFHGQWLRHCTDFPAWQARCVRAKRFRFIQSGHGQREAPDMRMGFLRGTYLHDISIHDEAEWFRRHRRYACEEAAQFLAQDQPLPVILRQLVRGPALSRRRAVKHLSHYLPGRPALRFIYQYLLRGGFLDGRGAYRYCRLLADYERLTGEEIRRQRHPVRV